MFLQCPSNDEAAIELAINTIGEAKNDSLTHELIDFLMGERDGIPKDAKFIFKLYMSLGQFKEAARTAVIIAREEQVMGNYRVAHDLLFDNYMQLKKTGVTVPAELDRMLMLVHSYVIVKVN
jgi:WD repeat-containing protein 19